MAVALRAHVRLPDRRRPPRPRRRGIRLLVEDGDLVRREAAAAQGLVRGEAGEPATDDGNARHFTEPASSPSAK